MSLLERAGLAVLRSVNPETAHGLALKALSGGLVPLPDAIKSPCLATSLAGLDLPNPVGLAAGFDKDGLAMAPLSRAGFGFIELGAVTPKPQPGNPRPRLFRLPQDKAVINRFGFNNSGAAAMAARLKHRPKSAVIGLNLGANKDSTDRAADYASVLSTCGAHLDFATVNVSSPNTEALRDLQGKAALDALLAQVIETRNALPNRPALFLKIAPDLTKAELADIAETALARQIDGIIATNTTLDRDGLHGPHKNQRGGLSGAPLFRKSTQTLADLYRLTDGKLPLIGVGGISSAQDAYAKIKAGATAVQLYTALAYHGLGLAAQIARELDDLAARDGHGSLAHAIGTDQP
ncbi:quinone-dependent dihydroorotate dehydrogenase [Actibacterium sp. 188UL27-1]|uniref:quinone-dependent dihydroorotate dehydrogenase n=1 Tax=Actibacterium sp. 188UL27-1 TaxID=2786961 RepID=UPI00195B607A|nr:quinone-dependent dihydroorotate dehydrogenase [Actibacterium sp. 188UL27-1]MBM7068258.1 quinone-dependent dihydroorotate dehydrogenase [Actibacterium sp. 188UL27-1]